jgi:DNA-directed RNA polymerase specialized sigma24 family protein
MHEITRILTAIDQGDAHAAAELLPLIYDELRKLAASKLAHEKPGQTLDATALVHEAYLRLVTPPRSPPSQGGEESGSRPCEGEAGGVAFTSRGHFFAAAAEAMRRILIDNARRRQAEKRGGGLKRQELAAIAAPEPDEELLALDEALQKLAAREPVKARLVELRYFAGLTADQAAEVLGISPSSADRHWAYARAWLQAEVRGK